jgi:hypothetical protein
MPPQPVNAKAQKEGRMLLAIDAYNKGHIQSIRKAAEAYSISYTSLAYRLRGRAARVESRPNRQKLTDTEEEVLERWILSMDERGYPLTVTGVRDAARILLQQRIGLDGKIGLNWPSRYIDRHPTLKTRYTRKYDAQRAQCEDPEVIEAWFRLVRNTIAKYGILDDDIYNFDETGFAMGLASTSRVVTASDRRGKPPQLQPGDREWVTAIESINAKGWSLPPMVIFKGKVHISTWYEYNKLPPDWTIALSANGWTNNDLGLHWLKEVFEKNTAPVKVGSHRLLILDGHGSHATPEIDQFCTDRVIITLCMPPHSSHLLQPLDVGCFSVLKRTYGQQIGEFIRLGINHIDKNEFLYAFRNARNEALSKSNILSSFTATGLVPFGPDQVLSTLRIAPHTPELLPVCQGQWQPETPHNLTQLEHQVAAIRGYLEKRSKSPPTPTDQALNQLVKGCQIAIQGAALLAAENEKLRAANERQTQKRQLKRKYISQVTALTAAEAVKLIEQPKGAPIVVEDEVDEEPCIEENPPNEEENVVITCFICRGDDHYAKDCQKYK